MRLGVYKVKEGIDVFMKGGNMNGKKDICVCVCVRVCLS